MIIFFGQAISSLYDFWLDNHILLDFILENVTNVLPEGPYQFFFSFFFFLTQMNLVPPDSILLAGSQQRFPIIYTGWNIMTSRDTE